MQDLGTLLARLGGADIGVVNQTPKEKSRYVAMGIVLLSTAFLAVLSMTFALIDGLHVTGPAVLLIGLGWGAVILNLDRVLILSLKPGGGRWRLLLMVAPRLLMAALLGLVIATPLTLRVFQSEIESQIASDNIKTAEAAIGTLGNGRQQEQLDKIKKEIARYEDILAGKVAYSSPNLEQAEKELQQAEADKKAKTDVYWEAYDAWRCELDGDRCRGASGKHGDGPRARSLKMKVDLAQTDLADASRLVEEKRAALTAAQQANKNESDTKLAADQAEANRVLPGLRSQRDRLQQAIAAQVGTVNDKSANNDGLLARLVALDHLGDDNEWARLAHLLVAGLLFMIELLPVAVKSLTILGPPTLYDQVNDLDDKRVLEDAVQSRNLVRRRRKRSEDKAIELDEDMYAKEVALGRKANDRVVAEMEKILDDALDNWAKQVAQTLHAQNQQSQSGPGGQGYPQGPQSPPNGATTPPGMGPQPAPGAGVPRLHGTLRGVLQAVAIKLNLPPSRKYQP